VVTKYGLTIFPKANDDGYDEGVGEKNETSDLRSNKCDNFGNKVNKGVNIYQVYPDNRRFIDEHHL
jgi:hypothetical protein